MVTSEIEKELVMASNCDGYDDVRDRTVRCQSENVW
jgi:hypothetical protein